MQRRIGRVQLFADMAARTSLRLFLLLALHGFAYAVEFKFPKEDADNVADSRNRKVSFDLQLIPACQAKIKNKRILVSISGGGEGLKNKEYDPHIDLVNERFSKLGFLVFKPKEIREQIIKAEVDAVLKNDVGAALSAGRRMSANYILLGVITSEVVKNKFVDVKQVNVSLAFSLKSAKGPVLSSISEFGSLPIGNQTLQPTFDLLNEKIDLAVAKIYSDFCGNEVK